MTLALGQAATALAPADERAIRSANETYRTTVLEQAWGEWAKHFASDGIMMPPNGPIVVGRASIEAWGRAFPRVAAFQNPIAELEGSGSLALMRGTYTLDFAPAPQPLPRDVGKYLVAWRKEGDGSWKVHRCTFSSDLPVTVAEAGSGDPWLGTWVLNTEKTRINPGPAPRSEVRTYTATAAGEFATYDTVDGDGKKMYRTSTYTFDGKDAKIVGDLSEDTMALTRTGPRSISAVIKKDGKVVRTATREVSADGKTLTVQFKGTNAKGQPILEEMWVFDRQRGGASRDDTIAAVKAAVMRHVNAINANDGSTIERQHTTDLTLILADVESRQRMNSPVWLAQLQKWQGSKVNWTVNDLEVQPLGSAAVATFTIEGTLRWPDGTVDSRRRRATEVWVNENGTWKEAHHHDSVFAALTNAR